MSSAKSGTVTPPPETSEAVLLPLIGAAAVLGGAASCFQMATRGMFRLGKQFYESIDARIAEAVAADLEKELRKAEQYVISEASPEHFELAKSNQQESLEQERQSQYDELIKKARELLEGRKQEEEEKDLRPDLSEAFATRIAAFAEQQKDALKRAKQTRPHNGGAQATEKDLNELADRIKIGLEQIARYDPLWAAREKDCLIHLRESEKAYNAMLCKVSEKQKEIEKHKETLVELHKSFLTLERHPLYRHLEDGEKQEFKQQFETCVSRVETGSDGREVISDCKKKVQDWLQVARGREMQERFEDNLDLLTCAIQQSGYYLAKQEKRKAFLVLTYRSEGDGKEAIFRLKKPDVENDDIDDFELQINADSLTEQERQAEGKRLMREIESTGIRVDYYDLSAPLNPGTEKEAILQLIKKQVARKMGRRPGDVQIRWVENNSVRINGTAVQTSGQSVQNVVSYYLKQAGQTPIRQAVKLKESH